MNTNLAQEPAELFPARILSAVLGVSKKTVVARALRNQWKWKRVGNRIEFCAPPGLLLKCRRQMRKFSIRPNARRITVRFHEQSAGAQMRTLCRLAIIAAFNKWLSGRKPLSCAKAVRRTQKKFAPIFPFGSRSLERWRRDFAAFGRDGVVEQKRGRSGRRKQSHHWEAA